MLHGAGAITKAIFSEAHPGVLHVRVDCTVCLNHYIKHYNTTRELALGDAPHMGSESLRVFYEYLQQNFV